MARHARILVATAIACGAGLIGFAAGGIAGTDRELRAAAMTMHVDHHCVRPPIDARQL
jgi:hypothetical protein